MEISCFNDLWPYLYSAIASFIIGTLHKMTVWSLSPLCHNHAWLSAPRPWYVRSEACIRTTRASEAPPSTPQPWADHLALDDRLLAFWTGSPLPL